MDGAENKAIHQGRKNNLGHGHGNSDIAVSQLCNGGGPIIGTMMGPPASILIWKKATPKFWSRCQSVQILPICPRIPESFLMMLKLRGSRTLCLCAGHFKGTPGYHSATITAGFYSMMLWLLIFPALEPWDEVLVWGCELVLFTGGLYSQDTPPY